MKIQFNSVMSTYVCGYMYVDIYVCVCVCVYTQTHIYKKDIYILFVYINEH